MSFFVIFKCAKKEKEVLVIGIIDCTQKPER
jgi:hypothetical protein